MVEPMPQDIEVWYIIPAIRRELVKSMRALGISQKEIAKKLGITEPAVSQYLSEKRGSEVKFGKPLQSHIKEQAKSIISGKTSAMKSIHEVTSMLSVRKITCNLHKDKCRGISGTCNICFKGE